jgi:hypothetical protein
MSDEWQKPQWEKKDPPDEPPPSLRKEDPPPTWQQQEPQQPQPQWQQPQQQQPPWGAPQQQPWTPAQPQWQQFQPSPPTPGSATAALILSICGILFCPVIGGPLGLVFGYKARGQIRDSNGQLGGSGMVTAALIMGWIGVGFTVLLILGILAIVAGSS